MRYISKEFVLVLFFIILFPAIVMADEDEYDEDFREINERRTECMERARERQHACNENCDLVIGRNRGSCREGCVKERSIAIGRCFEKSKQEFETLKKEMKKKLEKLDEKEIGKVR